MTSPWTEDRMARLTELWQAGLSASRIGEKMELSKNAIVGKAHRLGLKSRPSPINYSGRVATPRKAALSRATEKTEATVIDAPPVAQPVMPPSRRACLYIEGEKGRDFEFYADAPRCAAAPKPGSPYCSAHNARCHIKWQPRTAA